MFRRFLLLFFFVLSSAYVFAGTERYVDVDCTNAIQTYLHTGTSSVDGKGSCTGGSDYVYSTIPNAITAMAGGDDIIIRGGTYTGNVLLNTADNGSSEDWSEIKSYPGEWAIIDANNASTDSYSGSAIGRGGSEGSNEFNYWLIERLEIKNGSVSGGDPAAGIAMNRGPLKIRYCYIHDNLATGGGSNPGGFKSISLNNSIIEYNYFYNNGISGSTNTNAAHIIIYSDYDSADTADNGFSDLSDASYQNEIRYNYLKEAPVGFKYKSLQLFSSRRAWQSAYNTYGDKVHHNIFEDINAHGVGAHQDFIQVYNNIIELDNSNESNCISVQYEPFLGLYKVTIYNNTCIDPDAGGILRFKNPSPTFHLLEYLGYDYNNIIDNSGTYKRDIMVARSGGSYGTAEYDISGYYSLDNYFYRSDDVDVYRWHNTNYTTAEWEAQTESAAPRNQYVNAYDAGNLLYVGTTGADKYRTRGAHSLEGSDTIADGGVGGAHPYLSGVTIPSYVGATNPNDNGWVVGVLAMNVAWFTSQVGGSDPNWIEGAEDVISSVIGSPSSMGNFGGF